MKKLLIILLLGLSNWICGQQLSKGEYYYDTDPGLGNGIPFTFIQADSIDVSIPAPTNTLTVGFHKVYVRTQNVNNVWGLSYEHLFYVYDTSPPTPPAPSNAVAYMEYFFDNIDYGPGQCAPLNPFTPMDSVLVNGSVVAEDPLFLTPLSVGLHKLNIRARDLAGQWSMTKTVAFTVCDQSATASYTQTVSGTTVTFTNTSTNSFGSQWIFGDGTASSETNPIHNYNNGGTLNVGLVSYSGCGNDTVWNLVTLNCVNPSSSFSSTVNNLTASFTNTSSGASSYLWNFGDGRTSTEANPSHVFQTTGTYTVCLTTNNGCGSSTVCNTVSVSCVPPVANYNVNITGYTATLTNTSTNAYNFVWSFGDATTNNVDYNPVKQYSAPGNYNLRLTVNNGCGGNMYQTTVTIACSAPTVSFNAFTDGLGVEVENNSLNGTTWSWDFGDGTTSAFKNPPIHNYPSTGTYTITLIANNTCGADTFYQVVNVCTAPTAQFTTQPLGTTVNFTNTSTNASSYVWNFGNGLITNVVNPSHQYTESNLYSVCLLASNNCGNDTACSNVFVTCSPTMNPSICMVTVDDPGDNNIIYWDKTAYTGVDTFFVYREITNGNYSIIGKVPFDSLSMFIDTVRTQYFPNTGDPRLSAFKYKLAIKDTCGNLSAMSLYHGTMFLQDQLNGNFNWTHYEIEGQTTPVPALLNYRFLRDNDFNGIFETTIGTTTSNLATDSQYSTHQFTADWRIETDWTISCEPTLRLAGSNDINTVVVRSKSNIKNNRTVEIKDNENKEVRLKVYPNPANDLLNVEISLPNEKEATISIENMLGQVVYTMQTNKPINSINTSNLISGVYFVKVKADNTINSFKLIIQK
jgi:PKD repeat protein